MFVHEGRAVDKRIGRQVLEQRPDDRPLGHVDRLNAREDRLGRRHRVLMPGQPAGCAEPDTYAEHLEDRSSIEFSR